MITITTTDGLAAFCERASKAPYVTVDTEFLRERTYYSKLRLVQLAIPGDAEEDAVLCDPAAELDGLPREEERRLFLDDGIHFTPEGDARLGEIVGRCLEEAGLLDRLLP